MTRSKMKSKTGRPKSPPLRDSSSRHQGGISPRTVAQAARAEGVGAGGAAEEEVVARVGMIFLKNLEQKARLEVGTTKEGTDFGIGDAGKAWLLHHLTQTNLAQSL